MTRAGNDGLGITRTIARVPGNRLVRIQLNGFPSLTDTPAVSAAAPKLIITSAATSCEFMVLDGYKKVHIQFNTHTHMYI